MRKRWDLKRMLFNLSALVDLGQEMTSAKDYTERMKTALYVITGMLSVPRAALFVYDHDRRSLCYLTGKGPQDLSGDRLSIRTSDLVQLPPNEPFSLRSVRTAPFIARNKDVLAKIDARTLVSLFAKDEFIGLLALGQRLSGRSYVRSEQDVLKVAAHQLAAAVHNARLFAQLNEKARENKRLYEDMHRIYHETIAAFATAIDAKDAYTKHHSYRVANYAAAIARELGWKKEQVEAIYIAGLLHDIGKIIIDRDVINKGGDLTAEEREEIKSHPQVSYQILSKIRFPWNGVVDYIRHHHERPDGGGYPDSLQERELSEGVKILALSDAFDAMTTDRPYRRKLPVAEAVREIERCIGSQFDARVSHILFGLLRPQPSEKHRGPSIYEQMNGGHLIPDDPNSIRYHA